MNITGDDLAIVIPLFKRTKNIARVYESAMAATPDARVLFVASEHDHEVRDALESYCLEHEIIPGTGGEYGDYARKINAGYRATTEPLIFTGADDLLFHDGWYEAARSLISLGESSTQVLSRGATLTGPFRQTVECPECGGTGGKYETSPYGDVGRNWDMQIWKHCPAGCIDGRVPGETRLAIVERIDHHIGVVGTVDLCNERTISGEHSTHSLVARWYAVQGGAIDQSDVIYHEGYAHEYCDDELVAVARKRESYAHSFGPPVEHVHMLRDASLDDEVYQHGRSRTRTEPSHVHHALALLGRGGVAVNTVEEAQEYVGTTPLSGLAQMAILLRYGLKPEHVFAEIGCGALYLAKPLVPWLDKGNYCGMDPAVWLRSTACDHDGLLDSSLRMQDATFSAADDFCLRDAFARKFDVIFAHSVLSHTSHRQLLDCMIEIEEALAVGGVAIVTLNIADEYEPTISDEWQYPSGCTVGKDELGNAIGIAGLTGEVDEVARATYMGWCPDETHDWLVLRRGVRL